MPRVPPRRPSTLPKKIDLDVAVKKASHGETPKEVYDGLDDRLTSPASRVPARAFSNYTWDVNALDEVMKRYGVGDAREVLKVAVSLDAGDRVLDKGELLAAAQKTFEKFKDGFSASPSVVADIMKKRGIAEEGALFRAAQKLDDGDKVLSRKELEAAADVLQNVIAPHDVSALITRSLATAESAGFPITHLGDADKDLPIVAVDVPSTRQPPKLRVVITGGVHGDEPCGAAAAVLLLEQLARDPRLREEVSFTILPVVNPRGLAQGTRRTPEDIDLNRNMRGVTPRNPASQQLAEVKLLQDFLKTRKGDFDLGLDMHSGGAKRNGFWVLQRGSQQIAEDAYELFEERWPVLQGNAKPYTLSRPGVGASNSTETMKDLFMMFGAPWSMTLEAPGSVSYLDQVLGENEMAHAMIDAALVEKTRDSLRA